MKKKSKFTKKLLIEIGVMTAILFPLFLGIVFFKSQISNAVEKVNQGKTEVQQKTRSLNELVILRNQYNSFARDYLSVIYNIIPSRDDLIDLSQEFESIANNSNVGFGFSFLGETDNALGELGYINFRLTISGNSINEVTELIEEIEEFRYLTIIDRVSIQERKNEIQSNVEGRVFYRN
ncbi:MAG: hypothetical protein WDZ80_03955 [Candidatus Paceibacterota bacterium]